MMTVALSIGGSLGPNQDCKIVAATTAAATAEAAATTAATAAADTITQPELGRSGKNPD